MREDQAEQIIELLQNILEVTRAHQENFDRFTLFGVDNMGALGDRLTGGHGGTYGKTMEDIEIEVSQLRQSMETLSENFNNFTNYGTVGMDEHSDRVTAALSAVESAIDLK